MYEQVFSEKIQNVFIDRNTISDPTISTRVYVREFHRSVGIKIPCGIHSHSLYLGLNLGLLQGDLGFCASHMDWVYTCTPLLLRSIQTYEALVEHVEKRPKHQHILRKLGAEQYKQYVLDQMELDLTAALHITNHQFFEGLFLRD